METVAETVEDTYEYVTYRVPDFDQLDRLPQVDSLHDVFFTDNNCKGTILPDAYDYSSGWPTLDLSRIPQDDRTALIGQSYAIRLTTDNAFVADPIDGWYENSFYGMYDPTYAFWHYRNEHGDERLAVYIDSTNLPLFLIFATDLGSTEALRLAVEKEIHFPATLVVAANVDYEQSQYLFLSGILYGHDHLTAPLGADYAGRIVTTVGYRDGDSMWLFLDEDGEKAFWFVERMKRQYRLHD